MALMRNWFRLAAVSFGVLLAGCASGKASYKWSSLPVSTENIRALNRGQNEVTLSNGDVVLMSLARAYGDVSCDTYACVRHKDIVGLRIALYDDGAEDSPLVALIAAPVIVGAFAAVWAGQASHDARGTYSSPAAPAAPSAHSSSGVTSSPAATKPAATDVAPPPQDAAPSSNLSPAPVAPASTAATWLRRDARQDPENVRYSTTNLCLPEMPVSIETDAEALDWVYDNRIRIRDMRCLLSAAYAMPKEDEERRLRLWALGSIRTTWLEVHCAEASEIRRILPSLDYMSPNISAFDVITETLADDATYLLPDNYAGRCEKGLADPAATPDRATFAKAVDPFSSPGSAPWLRDRKMGDHG